MVLAAGTEQAVIAEHRGRLARRAGAISIEQVTLASKVISYSRSCPFSSLRIIEAPTAFLTPNLSSARFSHLAAHC